MAKAIELSMSIKLTKKEASFLSELLGEMVSSTKMHLDEANGKAKKARHEKFLKFLLKSKKKLDLCLDKV
jgi:hypothetical protein